MGELRRISFEGISLVLHSARGEVVGASKWSTTHVSGGGGGGYVHQGSGYSSTAPVTSTVTEHDQFFLRLSDGKEMPIRLENVQLAVRDGQDVSVLWGVPEGKEHGRYVAIINHTTGEQTMIPSGANILAGVMGCWVACLSIAGMVVGLSMVLLGLSPDTPFLGRIMMWAMGGAAGWFSFKYMAARSRRSKEILKQIKESVAMVSGKS